METVLRVLVDVMSEVLHDEMSFSGFMQDTAHTGVKRKQFAGHERRISTDLSFSAYLTMFSRRSLILDWCRAMVVISCGRSLQI